MLVAEKHKNKSSEQEKEDLSYYSPTKNTYLHGRLTLVVRGGGDPGRILLVGYFGGLSPSAYS